MNEIRFDSVLLRISSLKNPQNVWIKNGILCCGDDYPDGLDYQAVGTYMRTGFDEKQFREDVRFAETVV